MAIFDVENTQPGVIVSQVQAGLVRIRDAQEVARKLYAWSSGISLDELIAEPPEGPGMSRATAQALMDACSDAWGHQQLYETGTDPRNPGPGYAYGRSQVRVIGSRVL